MRTYGSPTYRYVHTIHTYPAYISLVSYPRSRTIFRDRCTSVIAEYGAPPSFSPRLCSSSTHPPQKQRSELSAGVVIFPTIVTNVPL
jgi:hypothetical protein